MFNLYLLAISLIFNKGISLHLIDTIIEFICSSDN